ncbi:MAG: succinylglutamate desuccinylase/aspartoacylase family protein, partial [Desulfovibrionaceae bacterium]|nr:succinylglutamate desuccinylase/aspartoacylase family protein [Desulfovibrionaceae bacterium]
MIKFVLRVFFIFFFCPQVLFAFPFTTVKRDIDKTGPVLLITAGIHGDEPAAFSAAGMLINNYTITSGRVWIVPNLNFQSILHTSRGIAGDMNRKFLGTNKNDPDYVNLEAIKNLILDPDVDFIYSMHDGMGFYREKHSSTLYSPYRWGQSIVIDQESLDSSIPHHNLKELGTKIVENINTKLIAKHESY